jgi:hypothetical protein
MKMQNILVLLLACPFLTLSFFSCSDGSTDAPSALASSVYEESDSTGYTIPNAIMADFQIDDYDISELRRLAEMAEEYEAEGYEDDEYYDDEEDYEDIEADYTEDEGEDDEEEYEDVEEDYTEDEGEDDDEWVEDEYSDETGDDEEGE